MKITAKYKKGGGSTEAPDSPITSTLVAQEFEILLSGVSNSHAGEYTLYQASGDPVTEAGQTIEYAKNLGTAGGYFVASGSTKPQWNGHGIEFFGGDCCLRFFWSDSALAPFSVFANIEDDLTTGSVVDSARDSTASASAATLARGADVFNSFHGGSLISIPAPDTAPPIGSVAVVTEFMNGEYNMDGTAEGYSETAQDLNSRTPTRREGITVGCSRLNTQGFAGVVYWAGSHDALLTGAQRAALLEGRA